MLLVDAVKHMRQANDRTSTRRIGGFSVIPERGVTSTLAVSEAYFSVDIYETGFTSTFIVQWRFFP